jgi:hypothetical protein
VPPEQRASGAPAQPLGLLVVGVVFLGIGVLSYPAFLGAGSVFTLVGLRGMKNQDSDRPEG